VLLPLVMDGYVIAVARAKRFFRSPRALCNLKRSTSVAMAGAAVAVATRS